MTGTLAPAVEGSWWHRLVEAGTSGSTCVQLLQGRPDRWDHWREIVRVNPLARDHAELADVLREERDAARADGRLKVVVPEHETQSAERRRKHDSADRSDDWERMAARPVPERASAGRFSPMTSAADGAWSAAVAVWRSGPQSRRLPWRRASPDLEAQEKRDRVATGTVPLRLPRPAP